MARATVSDRRMEELRALDIDEEALVAAMVDLDPAVREALAQGPRPRRFTCGVCAAFQQVGFDLEPGTPEYVVFNYHEIPKRDMRVPDDQWYGPAANDVYERCVATYRAAGWAGDAEEPNA